MTGYIVLLLITLSGLAVVFRLAHDARRIYSKVNPPLPPSARKLTYRVGGGQDAVAVALALQHAGYRTEECYLHGDTFLNIAVRDGTNAERQRIRALICNAPTLEDAEYHPPVVLFLDEETQPHAPGGRESS